MDKATLKELDKLILHHIFGVAEGHTVIAPEFSLNHNAAMDVVHRLESAFPKETYAKFIGGLESYVAGKPDITKGTRDPWAYCSPAEICVAALRAVGVKISH